MKSHRVAITAISLIVLSAFATSLLKIQLAHAQTDTGSAEATTSEPAPVSSPTSSSPTDESNHETHTLHPRSRMSVKLTTPERRLHRNGPEHPQKVTRTMVYSSHCERSRS
jgi:hypothetical protein